MFPTELVDTLCNTYGASVPFAGIFPLPHTGGPAVFRG